MYMGKAYHWMAFLLREPPPPRRPGSTRVFSLGLVIFLSEKCCIENRGILEEASKNLTIDLTPLFSLSTTH